MSVNPRCHVNVAIWPFIDAVDSAEDDYNRRMILEKAFLLRCMKNCCVIVLSWIILGGITTLNAQVPPVPTSPPGALLEPADLIRADRLGIAFISSIDSNNSPERYRNALILGAGWNRWPLYWDRVEAAPDAWDWSAYDRLVESDIRNHLKINAILQGRPAFWQDGGSILNLFEPIFADGTDHAGGGTPINAGNPWAQYVHRAVSRYKPGGILAQQRGFADGAGIRVWEIWNEPDIPQFWQGGSQAYARLLKTAAIIIKTLDPQATVLFGGLLYATDDNFLAQVLMHFREDALRGRYNWFFDAAAIHSYDDPWRSGWLAKVVQDTLKVYGLERPIWVSETGVSVWNDYPGPVWAADSGERIRLATTKEQAAYLIMSAVYAWSKDVDKVFFHQLYDDCGNQPAGTDFPPHHGEFCTSGACFGDAFGLYRNPEDAVCFSQHPLANTPRPAATAYRLLAEVFGRQPFRSSSHLGLNDPVTAIFFERGNNDRITVLWNNTFEPLNYALSARGAEAAVYSLNGAKTILPATDGKYTFNLKPATDFSYPDLEPNRRTAIGGEPIILVESTVASHTGSTNDASPGIDDSADLRPTVAPTIGTLIIPTATAAEQDGESP